jgi:hypothetical protein
MWSKTGRKPLLKEGWKVDRPELPQEDLNIGVPLQVDAGTEEFSPFAFEIFYRSASGLRYVTVHEMEQIRHMGAQRVKFERKAISPLRQRALRWLLWREK